jgi:hypothetical protein
MLARAAATILAVCLITSSPVWADAQADLQAAVKKLADSPNYSWTTRVEGALGGAPSDGKTEKNGYTTYTISTMAGSFPIVSKGDRTFAKTDNGWQGMAELQKASDDAQGFSSAGFILEQVKGFKAPATQLTDLMAKLQNLKKTEDGFSADLTADIAKDLFTFRFPGLSLLPQKPDTDDKPKPPVVDHTTTVIQQMTVKNPKGVLNVSMQNGLVTRFEIRLTGTINMSDKDQLTGRTTITEIKDIGTTQVTVPAEAKAILDQKSPPTGR